LAAQVDSLATIPIHDPGTRNFVHKFLGSEQHGPSIEEARASLALMHKSPTPSNAHLIAAAQILFRYRLLDAFADVLDVPPHKSLQRVPRTPRPVGTVERLDRVRFLPHGKDSVTYLPQAIDSLQQWPNILTKFRKIYEARQHWVPTPIRPAPVTEKQSQFEIGIETLRSMNMHQVSKDYEKVMHNMDVLVFSIWWLLTVIPIFCQKFTCYSQLAGFHGVSQRPSCSSGCPRRVSVRQSLLPINADR
jgi:hypothetical protein